MSRRTDIVAALKGRRPATAVPIWELEFHAWDAADGRHVVLGQEFERLTAAEQERAMHANAEIFLEVSEKMHFSALTVPGHYWNHAPGQLAYYVLPGDMRFRQFEILRKMSRKIVLVANTGGVLGANYDTDFCVKLFEAPEEIDQMARKAMENGLATALRFRDLGADAVFTASDMADNSGPFYNPEQMKRFVLPYLDEWAGKCKASGLYTILHSDGQLTKYLGAIADTAVDALQAVDPVAGMNMKEARRIVGDRLCLCGNVDCGLLVRGTPEQVYESTRRLLTDSKNDGAFVLGASNAVQPDVPIRNYSAMIEAWKKFGQYRRPVRSKKK